MRKIYLTPEVVSTPVSTQDLMVGFNVSVGNGTDQGGFYTPSRPNEYHENNN